MYLFFFLSLDSNKNNVHASDAITTYLFNSFHCLLKVLNEFFGCCINRQGNRKKNKTNTRRYMREQDGTLNHVQSIVING